MKYPVSIVMLLAALSGTVYAESAVDQVPANLIAFNDAIHPVAITPAIKAQHAAAFDASGEKALEKVASELNERLDAKLRARVERNLDIALQQ